MSEIPTTPGGDEPALQAIMCEAEARYGFDAVFVYPGRDGKVAITLEQAMAICGAYIADEDPELVWEMLDSFRAGAVTLMEDSPAELEQAREMGRNVLNQRGVAT